jgi:hypothetical protein
MRYMREELHMSKSKGNGETKSISWRESRKKVRQHKKSSHRSDGGGASAAVVSVEEFLAGEALTGHRVEIGNAVFEMVKHNTLTLVSAEREPLKRFTAIGTSIFVTIGQLINDSFESPLSKEFREKQKAMWRHIRAELGEGDMVALAALNKPQMTTPMPSAVDIRQIVTTVEAPAATIKPVFVGENAKRWNSATADIGSAFEAMSAEKPAEIRIGSNQHEGITLGFFWQGNGSIRTYVGHAGAKSSLSGKVVERAFLEIRDGKIPERLPESLTAHERGKCVLVIHEYVMGLPRILRDPIMHGLSRASGVISLPKSVVPPQPRQQPVLQVVRNEPQIAPPQADMRATAKAAPAMKKNGLDELVCALRTAGATPVEIAQAVLAYQESVAGRMTA